MPSVTLDTVFATYAANREKTGNPPYPGSLTIKGGTINIYFSVAAPNDPPADETEMTLDDDGPYGGVKTIAPAANWIWVETATGTPVVTDFRVIAP